MRNNEERLGAQLHQQAPTLPQNLAPQLSFIVPTEFVDLPSKGKLYPVGHPLRDKVSIEIKQMTAKEEDILTNKSFLKKGVVLDRLLESILVDKSLRPEDVLICDKNAIFVAARISGYGPKYETQIVCPSCEKKTRASFDLQEKLEKATEDERQLELTDSGTFFISLPSTKWKVECKALSGQEEKKIVSFATSKKDEFSLIEQLRLMVVSIEGVTDRSVLEQALQVMPAGDSKFLRREYDKIVPGLDMRHSFSCKECDYEEAVEVPLTAEFFWPK